MYVGSGLSYVQINSNNINGGWAESTGQYSTSLSYGIEIDGNASYVTTSGNVITNNAIAGIIIDNGAHHITLTSDNVHDNGYQGIQMASASSPYAIYLVGVTSQSNDLQYTYNGDAGPLSGWSYAQRYWAVHITDTTVSNAVCITNTSTLAPNRHTGVYTDGTDSGSAWYGGPGTGQASCP